MLENFLVAEGETTQGTELTEATRSLTCVFQLFYKSTLLDFIIFLWRIRYVKSEQSDGRLYAALSLT